MSAFVGWLALAPASPIVKLAAEREAAIAYGLALGLERDEAASVIAGVAEYHQSRVSSFTWREAREAMLSRAIERLDSQSRG